MKSYGMAAAGALVGVVVTCIFFWVKSPSHFESPTPDAKNESTPSSEKTCEVCKCGPSDEILPPPEYSAKLPNPLVTNHEAEVKVAWNAVLGAKSYNVYIEDLKGRVVKKYSTSRTIIYLKEVPTPANDDDITYNVFLTTVNANNVDGAKSVARTLKASKLASVVAPTVKQIVIED
jgi:hypothetical protein